MGCGKTAQLLIVAHNYESRHRKVCVIKPTADTKGGDSIDTRIGLRRRADILATAKLNLLTAIRQQYLDVSCVLVDEAQFLTTAQANQLMSIVVQLEIPVLCYGIRCDSNGRSWPGSRRLLEIAHNIEEIKTICTCGKKATMNCRFIDDKVLLGGPKTLIEGPDTDGTPITYRSLCPVCYYKNPKIRLPKS